MARHLHLVLLFALTAMSAGPSLAAAERPVVLVNPHVHGSGTVPTTQQVIEIVPTIQQGIDLVDPGGTVMVLLGTYSEAIVIDKGLTLEARGPVIIAPPPAPAGAQTVAIRVATPEPVTIRDATVQFTGGNGGVFGEGVVDVTVERARLTVVNPLPGAGFVVAVTNNATPTVREEARLSVRESFLDGNQPHEIPAPSRNVVGIRVQGDVYALLEGNVIRRTAACIIVAMKSNFGGETNANIFDNDLDECHPPGRLGSLVFQALALPDPLQPVTATGTVNIVGNIRNTSGSCLPTTAIVHGFGTGSVERNRVLGVVQPCAIDIVNNNILTRTRGAIWIGSLLATAAPTSLEKVRFNDIEGNAYAGLRVGPNVTTRLDARCNWWGSASGPFVEGENPGTGDAIVLELGAATPDFTPWAVAPIAETEAVCTEN